MSAFKRVLIHAANVHDGLGGVHLKGERPVLPADVADLFIAKNLASLDGVLTAKEAKAASEALEDERRQRDQKDSAEARMRQHDQRPPEMRLASHEGEQSAEELYLEDQGVPADDIPNPRRRRRRDVP